LSLPKRFHMIASSFTREQECSGCHCSWELWHSDALALRDERRRAGPWLTVARS
jgi:hypothetical protein